MTKYLDINDPGALKDCVKKERERQGTMVECPKCQGYGGWNLKVDAYGPGKHFKCSCPQCNGWGYVHKDSKSATCIHTRRELSQAECKERGIKHFGMCWHVTECTKCGHIFSYDSSG